MSDFDYEDEFEEWGFSLDYTADAPYETDFDEWYEDHSVELWSGRSRTVILANGDVWRLDLYVYTDGSRECVRYQLEDTCFDNNYIPF